MFYSARRPLPSIKTDLLGSQVADATALRSLKLFRTRRLPYVSEYSSVLKNENLTTPNEARYARLSCAIDSLKDIPHNGGSIVDQ